ncbi:MAG: GAF domain-containing protein, partial [Candidatus Dadabacteria bacterium]
MKDNTESLQKSLEYQKKLNSLIQRIHAGDRFDQLLGDIESDILELLDAERITVYQRTRNRREIVSKYKSGDDIKEIRVKLSTASIAGYAALSQTVLRFKDVYDESELKAVHPNLSFNSEYDQKSGFRTRSVIAVPIKSDGALLGLLQVLNKRGGGYFTEEDQARAEEIAAVIGQKFRYELKGTKSRYDYLVQTNRIKAEQLEELTERAKKEGSNLDTLLLNEAGISRAELGASFEHYYQVPFREYDPNHQIPSELLKGINPSYLQKQRWVPIEGDHDEVTILIDDPSDAQRIMEIQRTLPAKTYSFQVGFADDILRYLGQGDPSSGTETDLHELVGKL